MENKMRFATVMHQKYLNVVVGILFYALTCQQGFAKQLDYRLSKNIQPTSQYIELDLDPAKQGYTGETTIDINVKKQADSIGLYWLNVNVVSIELVSSSKIKRELKAKQGKYDIHWLSDGKPIKSGKYQLNITFNAKYSTDALGLYKTTYQGNDYLFTQFEALFARRAFPIFDEPDFKIPYQLTITVPKELKVATNTPVIKQTEKANTKTVFFKATPPMPSYLIAMIVGDFDKTPITGLSVPGVVYSPKGTGGDTGFAIKHTPNILTVLEDYFGIDYPYEKLDFVAVPDYAFGAMENAGLVTYRTELLLRGDNATAGEALATINVIAHELAHMWYGDLVTMKWWDDLWLNEAFATWMANKVLDSHYPQYQSQLDLPQEGAFYEDALSTTKAIRKEVKTEKEIEDGMGLNYTKGHAILNMIEQTIGAENFQKAIQKYMKQHRWGNTVASDLWQAFSQEVNKDIGMVADSFLNQAGYPVVSIDEKGNVSQKRFRNHQSTVTEQSWNVPLTVKYKVNGKVEEEQLLLTEKPIKMQSFIEADWVFPVVNGNGYYRWTLSKSKYESLLNDVSLLTEREKMALLSNSTGLLNAGEITIAEHLTLLTQLTKENNAVVFLKALENIKTIGEQYINAKNQLLFSEYITEILTPWYEKIGTQTRPSDDDSILRLRPRLLRTLGQLGNNPKLNNELVTIAYKYLAEDKTVDDNLGREALRITAMLDTGAGDSALVKQYFDTYLRTNNASLKSNIMGAMYFTDQKSIEYVLNQMLNKEIPAGDKAGPLSGTFYINKDQSFHYKWFEENFDELVKSIPQIYHGYLPFILAPGCQAENIERLRKLFKNKGDVYSASLDKALEAESNCLALTQREAASFERFLSE